MEKKVENLYTTFLKPQELEKRGYKFQRARKVLHNQHLLLGWYPNLNWQTWKSTIQAMSRTYLELFPRAESYRAGHVTSCNNFFGNKKSSDSIFDCFFINIHRKCSELGFTVWLHWSFSSTYRSPRFLKPRFLSFSGSKKLVYKFSTFFFNKMYTHYKNKEKWSDTEPINWCLWENGPLM